MIRRLVDFALNNRLLVLAVATLLFIWGVISFKNLPVEHIRTSPTITFR